MADTTHVITAHEDEQIQHANASGLQPVVFVHGLWLLPSSWDRWAGVFEEAGYTAVSPGWPDDPETVEEAKEHPTSSPARPSARSPTISATSSASSTRSSKNPDCGPLLLISREKDNTVPWALTNGAYKKQKRNEGVTQIVEMKNRGHALTIDSGWREVADTALAFVKRFV